MAENESLFSLEVVIESLGNIVVPCVEPAIAFRLLDFPTLAIQKDEKMTNTESGTYNFYTGKSCLFKMNKDILQSNLERTPLFVMLVDVSGGRAKLLASTTISLVACFEKVLKNIEVNGLDMPTVQGNRGIFELYNLMGTPVALTKLCYRIFSLGGTINGHVKCAEPLVKPTMSNKVRQVENWKSKTLEDTVVNSLNEKLDMTLLDAEESEKPEKVVRIPHVNIETQTDIFCEELRTIHKGRKEHHQKLHRKDNVNITRPPPLYYNSKSIPDIPQTLKVSRENTKMATPCEQIILVEPEVCQYQTVSVQTEQAKTNEVVDVSTQFRQNITKSGDIVDLPLINALLRELTIAQQNLTNSQQPKNTIHKPSYNMKPQNIPLSRKQSDKAAIKKVASHTNKRSFQKVKTTNAKGVLIQRNPIKFKKSDLKCRTTKTQKLREALNRRRENDRNLTVPCEPVKKQNVVMQKSTKKRFIAEPPKETREFACQVTPPEDITKLDVLRADVEDGNQGPVYKEAGVQVLSGDTVQVVVQQSDFVQFNKEELVPTLDDKTIGSQSAAFEKYPDIGFPDELSQTNVHISAKSNSEWSSYSGKSTPRPALLASVEPTFSNFSPTPRIKNSRYTKKKSVSHSKGTSSQSDSENKALSKTDLVGKPVNDLSNVSSIEQHYSDEFDSFESGHTTSKSNSSIEN